MQLDWPVWMEDNVWQWLIIIAIGIIGIIVPIVLKLRSKRPSKVTRIDGDDNIQVINSPGATINKVSQIKDGNSDYRLVQELQKGIENRRECSQREIEVIHSSIFSHVTSYEYTKAINEYENNRKVLDAHKDKYKELIVQIEELILEARNERI